MCDNDDYEKTYDEEQLILNLLDKPDINYNHVDNYGDSILMLACKSHFVDVALKLLDKPNINYNYINHTRNIKNINIQLHANDFCFRIMYSGGFSSALNNATASWHPCT